MKKKCLVSVLGVLIALSAAMAPGAAASTVFGNNCTGNGITEGEPLTFFSFTAFGDPLPLAAPSSGVITKWSVNSQIPAAFHQTLKVVRQNGPKTVQIVGEALGTVSFGTNNFETRIPVQTGDLLGLLGTGEAVESTTIGNLFCEIPGGGENAIGAFLGGGGGPGSTVEFVSIPPAEAGFPVSATIEPDADNDGYGDETQDKCPQSAATQAPCPVVTLSATSAVKKSLATISVTASAQVSVTVAGTVKLGKGKTVKLNAGTQIVAPGALARFVLPFPQKLQSALKALPKKRFLTLSVTASAPNIVGSPTVSTLKLHLKGQAKPKKQSRKKARS